MTVSNMIKHFNVVLLGMQDRWAATSGILLFSHVEASHCFYKGRFLSLLQLLSLNPSRLTQTGRPCSFTTNNRCMS